MSSSADVIVITFGDKILYRGRRGRSPADGEPNSC
jgi:hypothetical protein